MRSKPTAAAVEARPVAAAATTTYHQATFALIKASRSGCNDDVVVVVVDVDKVLEDDVPSVCIKY